MNALFVNLILCFSVYSILGWSLETAFKAVRDRQFVNSGFLYGPFIPIYGFGAIMAIQSLMIIDPLLSHVDPFLAIIIKLALIIVLASLVEYFTAAILECLFKRQWWDYSDGRFHIKGRVSLKYSILWGILGYILLSVIQPLTSLGLSAMPAHLKYFLTVFIVVFLTLDLAKSLYSLWDLQQYLSSLHLWREDRRKVRYIQRNNCSVKTISENESVSSDLEYASCIDDLIIHPLIQMMRQFRHHKNSSCLDHSLNVSYTSFMLCKALGWDYRAAARGGLLHDLFLYDWRTTTLNEGRHGFVHPQIALDNASLIFSLNDLEKDIILKHMFPLTWRPPVFRESLLVCLVDKYCALKEVLGFSASSDNFYFPGVLQNGPC
ncbi:MAG TPA: hypothetical protein VN426_18420 [Syntrophomonadaceae bacterium]|nr:hypothetical protein [Syntrophomonadaceae bacterium]